MMKYRNKEYNKERNEMMHNGALLILALAAGAAGHILVSTNSAAVAALSLAAVLGVLGIKCIKSIKEEKQAA